jgi:hypothetical protein
MKKFNSWREAFNYQQNLRGTEEGDPYYIYYYKLEDTFENPAFPDEMVYIGGATDDEVVWLIAVDNDDEATATQFGVGKDQKWYSIVFNHTIYDSTVIVENSFKSFPHLKALTDSDSRANLVYKHIGKLFEIYEFLANGKIEIEDEVSELHLRNAEKIKYYASFASESQDEDMDEEEDEEEIDWDEDEDDEDEEDFDLDSDSDIDDSLDEDEDDTDDYDFLDVEVPTYPEVEERKTLRSEHEFLENSIGHFDQRDEQFDDLEEDEKVVNMYKFHYSTEREGEKMEQLFEGSEVEAFKYHELLLEGGYKFVEMSQLIKVTVNFQ